MGIKILSADKFSDKSKDISEQSNKVPQKSMAFFNKNGQFEFHSAKLGSADLRNVKAVKFALSDTNDDLYLILCNESDKDTFAVGEFLGNYYVFAAPVFQSLGYEIPAKGIKFDLFQEESMGDCEVFRIQPVDDDQK